MGTVTGSGSVADPGAQDLDLRILSRRRGERSNRVVATGPQDRGAAGRFRSPFSHAEIEVAVDWMDRGMLDSDAVRDFGVRLYRALFHDGIDRLATASAATTPSIGIRLTIDDPAVARIPWELIADPATRQPLVLRGRFVRGVSTGSAARPSQVAPPLRVLVVDAAPRDQTPLAARLEVRDIASVVEPLVRGDRLTLTALTGVTAAGLLDALRDASRADPPQPFHVLHWIGHGAVAADGSNVLVFEDRDGWSDPVDGPRLASLIADSDIRLVILNACHSAAPGLRLRPARSGETTMGLADALLESGVPAVIGMRVGVVDERARTFARELYRAFADGAPIDAAVFDARRLLVDPSRPGQADVGVPVVYLRSSARRLQAARPSNPMSKLLDRFRALRPIARAAVFAGVVLAGVGVERGAEAMIGWWMGPGAMGGDLNVVVTEFSETDRTGALVQTEAVHRLATHFYDQLREDLEQIDTGPGIETRGPEEAGGLSGSTPDERARSAAELARRIDADVIVYAFVDQGASSLRPEFYVDSGKLAGAEELEGRFRLGGAVAQLGNLESFAANQEVQRALADRTRALAEVVVGLSYFEIELYDKAEQLFRAAEPRVADDGWRQVVALFLGTTAGKAGRLEEARARYEEALAIDPQFARGRLGLAEVRLQESKGTCEAGDVDAAGLGETERLFRAALLATDQPPSAHVPEKVHFGVARVAICGSQALLYDRWDEADAELSQVIAAYSPTEPTLERLAGQAFGARAIARLPTGPDAADATERYTAALADYTEAIKLDGKGPRTAMYYAGMGRVLERLGRGEEARLAYDEAIARAVDAETKTRYERLRDRLDPAQPSPAAGGG